MVERDYSHSSPQELNRELLRLYSQFPSDIFADLDMTKPDPMRAFELTMKSIEVGRTRAKSEHRKLLLKRFEEILKYAHITETFRQSIYFALIPQYEVGVIMDDGRWSEGSREPFKVGWLLDKDDPQSGGIFDPKRAREIEREGFRRAVQMHMRAQLDQPLESIVESKDIPEGYKKWREEFIDKHCEQP